MTEIFRELE